MPLLLQTTLNAKMLAHVGGIGEVEKKTSNTKLKLLDGGLYFNITRKFAFVFNLSYVDCRRKLLRAKKVPRCASFRLVVPCSSSPKMAFSG